MGGNYANISDSLILANPEPYMALGKSRTLKQMGDAVIPHGLI